MIYKGNIIITEQDCKEWKKRLKNVTKITGFLSIRSNATLKADKLEKVGRFLYIRSKATVISPNLKTFKGNKYIYGTLVTVDNNSIVVQDGNNINDYKLKPGLTKAQLDREINKVIVAVKGI